MCSITQVLPEDFETTSVRIFGSTPNPSAILNASLTATAATPAIRLLQIFATSPDPTGPTWMMLAPRHARTGRASGDGSVDEAHAAVPRRLGHPTGRGRVDRGHVHAEPAPSDPFEDPGRAQVGRLDVRGRREHGDHELAHPRSLRRRAGPGGAALHGALERGLDDVVGDDGVALLQEVREHRLAHGAGPDESDLH